jgi:hypothetical protein
MCAAENLVLAGTFLKLCNVTHQLLLLKIKLSIYVIAYMEYLSTTIERKEMLLHLRF